MTNTVKVVEIDQFREKLIELLTEYFGVDPAYYGIETQHFADHLIANGVTVQAESKVVEIDQFNKWIPVTERLPEKEGTYLTYTEKERIHLDCFCIYPNHGTQFWVRGNGKVTHWMPLPQPQKGE